MRWLLYVGVGLAAAIAAVAIVGTMLPRTHMASRRMRLQHAPEEVWPVLMRTLDGSAVPVDVLENRPPVRLVTRVKESERNFGGRWTIDITPASDGGAPRGSTVAITEDGWVANPIFRFVSRFVIGHHATMDGILTSVARALNERADVQGQ
jgi:hypothetical protein